MRSLALSIVILSGALMAAAGTIAESLPDARRFNQLDTIGLILVAVGVVLLVIDLTKHWSALSSPKPSPSSLTHESPKIA